MYDCETKPLISIYIYTNWEGYYLCYNATKISVCCDGETLFTIGAVAVWGLIQYHSLRVSVCYKIPIARDAKMDLPSSL